MTQNVNPQKWHTIYRGSEDKCFFCGKDGKSGLARSEYDWRTTDSLARESGLTKRRTEEIIDYYCKRGVVIQHTKDPEKWGYWERVGAPKGDPDPVKKDHDDRSQKQQNSNGGTPSKKPAPSIPNGKGTAPSPSLSGGGGKINTPKPATTLPAKVPSGTGKSTLPPVVKPGVAKAPMPKRSCGTKCP